MSMTIQAVDATKESSRPTGENIDDLCIAFDDAKIKVDDAQQQLSSAKGDLQATIQSYGYTPANAEKTTRLEGLLYIADSTEGTTVEMNEAVIAELQSELSRLKKPKVFKNLFARRVSHSLKKDASSALKIAIGNLDQDVQARMLSLFATCFSVNTKAPSIKVHLAQALRDKEAKAEQKAKKTKKGGK